MISKNIKNWLSHPLARGMNIDDPLTTQLRRKIIREKYFLRMIYQEWYKNIAVAIPLGDGDILELGSGAGFLNDYLPDLITSEVFECLGVDAILDGLFLPFAKQSLRGIVMTDVFHHLPRPRLFLSEATRCMRPGGVVVMIEPWVTLWSRQIYTQLHHEPFHPESKAWEFPNSGPLSGANGALPWIIFERDRAQFMQEFPEWEIQSIRPFMPFRYLVSGGVSMRSLMPGCTFGIWRALETVLEPWQNKLAMFAEIILVRQSNKQEHFKEKGWSYG
jgi:SAM-dependent methyltransferase